ncbi:transcriptional regulatory protein YpdB [Clostridium saccharobutylicum]|uniref:Transcriptional regulatory protein YpdB n=1 Tax=Clostridium saccharobutylicum TaxID=169679 RepID=A0A1S8MQL8_CLOSA|nr:transcriptional regulatory protein YpdB [Clostridium saccharobutylicum]
MEENFIRCQKGYLVNIEKVVAIVPYFNSTLALKFKGHDKTVPVGRKFAKHFKDIIGW